MYKLFIKLFISVFLFTNCKITYAVEQYIILNSSDKDAFIYDLSDLSTSLNLSLIEYPRTAYMNPKIIEYRIKNFQKNPTIEPIQIKFTNYLEIKNFVENIAKPNAADILYKLLIADINEKTKPFIKITLLPLSLNYLDTNKLSQYFKHKYYEIAIPANQFIANPQLKENFLNQLQSFLSTTQINTIKMKIANQKELIVKEDILPTFAAKVVGKYPLYKGPNCFQAALGFHDYKLVKSKFINVIEEPNYHHAMINNDELWRLLNTQFYEVKGSKIKLQYGDMIVFFDLSENNRDYYSNYKPIKHATTYLFGPYTFSKASKHSDSPYVITTLQKEWAIWKKLTKNLGIKVYRKIFTKISKIPPPDLHDWLN